LGMESAVLAGEALANDRGVFVDQDGHRGSRLSSPSKGEVGAPAPGGGPCCVSQSDRGFSDHLQDAGEILRDIIVPEPKFGHAAAAEPTRTLRIANFVGLMLAAV